MCYILTTQMMHVFNKYQREISGVILPKRVVIVEKTWASSASPQL